MNDPDLIQSTETPTTRHEPIVCIECRRVWLDPGERWRMYVLEEDPPETVPYCAICAAREFG